MASADKVNLAEKLAQFSDHWQPRTVARFNDNDVMVVKVQGEFIWHKLMEPTGTPNTGDPRTAAPRREL